MSMTPVGGWNLTRMRLTPWSSAVTKPVGKPFASTPVVNAIPPPKFTLDETIMMNEIIDGFQKLVVVSEDQQDDSKGILTKLKQEEIEASIKQLSELYSSVISSNEKHLLEGEDTGEGAEDIIDSLAKVLSVLEPADITTSDFACAILRKEVLHTQKLKMLADMRVQVAELKTTRKEIEETMTEIRNTQEEIKQQGEQYMDQMNFRNPNELKILSELCDVDIAAEMHQFKAVEKELSICSEDKINCKMAEVSALNEELENLDPELIFTRDLPPNLPQIRELLEQRKKKYRDLCRKVEDETEYGHYC